MRRTATAAALALALLVPGALAAGVSAPSGSASPSPLAAVRGTTIVIDPGHNPGNGSHPSEVNRQVNAGTHWKACDTTGTSTDSGYVEGLYNWDVSVRLRAILRRAGARVVLTRPGIETPSWGPCITERAAVANRVHADVALSVHADGGPSSGRGFHVIYAPSVKGLTDDIAAASYRLALDIRGAYARTGMPYSTYIGSGNALDARSDLGGLNLSDVPKVFIESGNMRNPTDAALLTTRAFRQRAASALARGLAAFLAR